MKSKETGNEIGAIDKQTNAHIDAIFVIEQIFYVLACMNYIAIYMLKCKLLENF